MQNPYAAAHCAGASLEDAQLAKLDALIAAAGITADDHVIEIGCGWGSCAIRAVQVPCHSHITPSLKKSKNLL